MEGVGAHPEFAGVGVLLPTDFAELRTSVGAAEEDPREQHEQEERLETRRDDNDRRRWEEETARMLNVTAILKRRNYVKYVLPREKNQSDWIMPEPELLMAIITKRTQTDG